MKRWTLDSIVTYIEELATKAPLGSTQGFDLIEIAEFLKAEQGLLVIADTLHRLTLNGVNYTTAPLLSAKKSVRASRSRIKYHQGKQRIEEKNKIRERLGDLELQLSSLATHIQKLHEEFDGKES